MIIQKSISKKGFINDFFGFLKENAQFSIQLINSFVLTYICGTPKCPQPIPKDTIPDNFPSHSRPPPESPVHVSPASRAPKKIIS